MTEKHDIIDLSENDVVIIIKEEGRVELSFPEIRDGDVPDNTMAAFTVLCSVLDNEFFDLIQERFAPQVILALEERKHARDALKAKEPQPKKPHLKIIS